MTGKLADTVMAVRNGEQLARKYQPVVYNPSTSAQVAQRAKMKLISQLSAVMAPVIAIPRAGSVSSRNLFTKVNFKHLSFANNNADADLLALQLTKSAVGIPEISATREGNVISVNMAAPLTANAASRVVYIMFIQNPDNTLRYGYSEVVESAGVGELWPAEFNVGVDAPAYIYAYAVRDNTEAARVSFGDMEVLTAERVAQLVASRVLTESDVTLSETHAIYSAVPQP